MKTPDSLVYNIMLRKLGLIIVGRGVNGVGERSHDFRGPRSGALHIPQNAHIDVQETFPAFTGSAIK